MHEVKPDSELLIIPRVYLTDFQAAPDQAEREHGARCSRKTNKFVVDIEFIDVFSDRESPIDDDHRLKSWFRGIPGIEYYAHVDLGSKEDHLGLALGHQNGIVTIIDLAEDWAPEDHGGEIFFEDVRTRLRVLRDERGFNIRNVGYDSWQSFDTIQLMNQIYGFDCSLISTDRDMKVATQWLWAVNLGLLDIYDVPRYRKEAKDLILINGKKVDHPKKGSDGAKGSKDIFDAVASVTWQCRQNPTVQLTEKNVITVGSK